MYFKKNLALIIVSASCILIFLVLFIPTTVINTKIDYAENHYEVTTKEHKEGTKSWIDYGNVSTGCGEMSCKFCEGKKLHSGWNSYENDYNDFVYYATLKKARTIFNVFKVVFAVVACAVFIVTLLRTNFKEDKKTALKQNENQILPDANL